MINLNNEQLLPLRDAPNHLPRRRGKKVHYSTIYRWATKGARGKVLDTQLLGGVRYTSTAALDRFFAEGAADTRPSEEASALRRALYGKPS